MKNVMKKTLCLLLSVLMLTVAFVSCDNGNDDDRVSATGEIGADAVKNLGVRVWTGEGKTSDASEAILDFGDETTYDQFKTTLAQGARIKTCGFRLKNVKDLEGKQLTKVSFVLEADRAVTLTVAAKYSTYDYFTKTITLEANKTQTVEIEFSGYTIDTDKPFSIDFLRIAEGKKWADHYGYNTAEQGEWSQTIYKITDFKLFCS